MPTEHELKAILLHGLEVDPPLRAGIPEFVFEQFLRTTAKWLLDGSPNDQLPLYTSKSLHRALHVADERGSVRRTKRSAHDRAVRNRQTSEALDTALENLTARLRGHAGAKSNGETILVRFESHIGNDRYVVEVTGYFSQNRRATGFPEDDRIGLLARFMPPIRTSEAFGALPDSPRPIDTQQHAGTSSLLPTLPSLFIGRRTALLDLIERLCNPPSGAAGQLQVLAAVRGLPGVGKTSVAAALSHDSAISDSFADGVLWTALGKTPNVLRELQTWGRALAIPYILEVKSVPEASALVAAALRDRRALLIVDDVWNVEHAAPFRVGGRQCATLITTRLPAIADALAGVPEQVYSLPLLIFEDSRELLTALAPTVVREYSDAVDELLRNLDGLPLAIQVAGRLLASHEKYGFDVKQLLRDLHDGSTLLEESAPADYSDVIKETTPSVAALLRKSTDVLPQSVRDRFAYLGALAPKPARFNLAVLRRLWLDADPIPTVRSLLDLGLIERIENTDQYEIHALIGLHARSLASP